MGFVRWQTFNQVSWWKGQDVSKSLGFLSPQVSPASTTEYQPRAGSSAWCVPSLCSPSLCWSPALSTGTKEESIPVGANLCWLSAKCRSDCIFRFTICYFGGWGVINQPGSHRKTRPLHYIQCFNANSYMKRHVHWQGNERFWDVQLLSFALFRHGAFSSRRLNKVQPTARQNANAAHGVTALGTMT